MKELVRIKKISNRKGRKKKIHKTGSKREIEKKKKTEMKRNGGKREMELRNGML